MKVVKRLVSFSLIMWKGIVLSVVLGWATVVSWVALMSTSAYLLSYAALHPSVAELQVAIVGVRFFGISRGVFRYLERLVSHNVSLNLLAKMREWIYVAVEPLAPAGLQDRQESDLLSRMINDVETLQEFFVRVIAPPLVAILSTTSVVWFFGRWSWQFGLIILGLQIVVGIVIPLVSRILGKKPGQRLVQLRSKINAAAVEGVQGNAEIVMFGEKEGFLQKFVSIEKDYDHTQRKMNIIQAVLDGVSVFSTQLSALLLLLAAIPLVNEGNLDGRLLAVVVLGALVSFESVAPLPKTFQYLEESIEAGKRLFELTDQIPIVPEEGALLESVEKVDLEIKHLSFAYSQISNEVLNDFDLELPYGKKAAIVGPSGAGKSTLFSVLLRYWDYVQGEVMLNGQELRTLSPEAVRSVFGVISQSTYLFNTSIMDNIRLGNPKASLNEVKEAARFAEIDEFIQSLPQGYDTYVGEQGGFLSGGQRQRVAIARAILKDAPVIIADEPTANLDTITARKVMEKLLGLSKGKSLLLITHQTQGLAQMDEIVYLDAGRVVERGTYEALIELKGHFYRMRQLEKDLLPT